MSEKRKTIIRAERHDQPYFMLARSVAQNTALSYEALGLLTYLLSKPGDWVVQPDTLMRAKSGRDKVYRLLRELIAVGHVEKRAHRGDHQRITGVEYIVYEIPRTAPPLPEKPYTVEPYTVKPDTVKPHITEYREEQSKEESTRAPELPDHAPVAARAEEKPVPQPDGGTKAYAIVEGYCDAWDVVIERYRKNLHITHLKAARQLAELGASPDEVRAMIAEKRAAGKQMDEYPLVFAARDYVAWKAKQDKFAPVVVDEKTAWRAAQKARPNVKYDAGMDMLLPAFKDEDDRRRYITEYMDMPYVPFVEEAAP